MVEKVEVTMFDEHGNEILKEMVEPFIEQYEGQIEDMIACIDGGMTAEQARLACPCPTTL